MFYLEFPKSWKKSSKLRRSRRCFESARSGTPSIAGCRGYHGSHSVLTERLGELSQLTVNQSLFHIKACFIPAIRLPKWRHPVLNIWGSFDGYVSDIRGKWWQVLQNMILNNHTCHHLPHHDIQYLTSHIKWWRIMRNVSIAPNNYYMPTVDESMQTYSETHACQLYKRLEFIVMSTISPIYYT